MSDRFPGAQWLGDGHEWGPLPDRGMTTLALVYHTTETEGRPGYNKGEIAPHLTVDPKTRMIWQHGNLSKRMGSMLGFTSAGVAANDKSFQVEWICYSSKKIADDSRSRLWVGDWDDEMYGLAAEIMAWFVEHKGIGLTVHSPPLGGSWKHGAGSELRMAEDNWKDFAGLTAHGGVPGQVHWDTGVMDLTRIRDEASALVSRPDAVVAPAPASGAGMFPLRLGDESEDVRFVKEIAREAGHLTGPVNATYDEELRDLVARRFRGDADQISGAQAAALIGDMIRAMTPVTQPVEEDITHLAE